MSKYQVTFETNEDAIELLCAELFEWSADAVEIRDHEALEWLNQERPPESKAWAIASFDSDDRDQFEIDLKEYIKELNYPVLMLSISINDSTDWAHKWKEFYKPLRISEKIWIVPSWETKPDDDQAIIITIDPQMAFGTGGHATTRLCLQAIEDYSQKNHDNFSNQSILDIGCGSGILTIGCVLLGNHSSIGIDNDEQSVLTSHENAKINKVSEFVNFICDDAYSPRHEWNCKKYNLIIANILKDPLIDLAALIRDLINEKGTIILSGLLNNQSEDVIKKYQSLNFELIDHKKEDDWSALVMIKK